MRFGPGTAKLPESCFHVAVIEVDGEQHYVTGETASPELYGDDKARDQPTYSRICGARHSTYDLHLVAASDVCSTIYPDVEVHKGRIALSAISVWKAASGSSRRCPMRTLSCCSL